MMVAVADSVPSVSNTGLNFLILTATWGGYAIVIPIYT